MLTASACLEGLESLALSDETNARAASMQTEWGR